MALPLLGPTLPHAVTVPARRLRPQEVAEDHPVAERLQPDLAAPRERAAHRPADPRLTAVHEHRQHEVRPPARPPHLVVDHGRHLVVRLVAPAAVHPEADAVRRHPANQ